MPTPARLFLPLHSSRADLPTAPALPPAPSQNAWRRDRAADGSILPDRHGMRLADFVRLPVARRGMLSEAHVVALRLYSTSGD